MAVVSADSNGIELISRDSVHIKNNGHSGLAIKTFGLALRSSLLHLSRRELVSKFQTV